MLWRREMAKARSEDEQVMVVVAAWRRRWRREPRARVQNLQRRKRTSTKPRQKSNQRWTKTIMRTKQAKRMRKERKKPMLQETAHWLQWEEQEEGRRSKLRKTPKEMTLGAKARGRQEVIVAVAVLAVPAAAVVVPVVVESRVLGSERKSVLLA